MHVSARPADVLFFHCRQCSTELSVPVALQGVEGPCPHCGERIQAPLCHLPVVPQPVYLPPLDRRHEPPAPEHTESIPLPDWMEPAPPRGGLSVPPLEETTEILLAEPPMMGRSVSPGIFPRQLSENSQMGFQARLAIPESGSSPDAGAPEPQSAGSRRPFSARSLHEKWDDLMYSPGLRVARMTLLLGLGGLCAGLVLYLKDRKWVMSLPWKPAPVETVVDLPPPALVVSPGPVGEIDPFLAEDASEMEALSRPPAMAPVPEATSVPVGAAPLPAEK